MSSQDRARGNDAASEQKGGAPATERGVATEKRPSRVTLRPRGGAAPSETAREEMQQVAEEFLAGGVMKTKAARDLEEQLAGWAPQELVNRVRARREEVDSSPTGAISTLAESADTAWGGGVR